MKKGILYFVSSVPRYNLCK